MSGAPVEAGAYHDQHDETGLLLAVHEFSHGKVSFESEASYLRRLGLLLPGEAKGLKAAAYRPEVVPSG